MEQINPEQSSPNQSSNVAEQQFAAKSPNVEADKPALDTSPAATAEKRTFTSPNVAQEVPISERRQAYGTATTENLRDSGLWRILLPGFVILCCLAMLAIPFFFLIPLFVNSLNNHVSLIWLWIILMVVDLGIAAIITRGFVKIFLTEAGNYSSS